MESIVLLMYVAIVVYGFMFGVVNTGYRLFSMFTSRKLIQSELGKIMDLIWYIFISYALTINGFFGELSWLK